MLIVKETLLREPCSPRPCERAVMPIELICFSGEASFRISFYSAFQSRFELLQQAERAAIPRYSEIPRNLVPAPEAGRERLCRPAWPPISHGCTVRMF